MYVVEVENIIPEMWDFFRFPYNIVCQLYAYSRVEHIQTLVSTYAKLNLSSQEA